MTKSNIIVTLLCVGFTQALEETSSDFCQNDLTPPVICGINEEEFGNLCLAMNKGGFEEGDCTPIHAITFTKSLTKPDIFCAIGSSYKPVVCTASEDENGTTTREIHQNVCAARIIGGFQDEDNECTCYEFEDIVYLMSVRFGEDKCQFITPRPMNERDAQVWYSCHTGDHSEETEPDRILSAKLVASGILGDAPMPLHFTIDLNIENQPSTIAMLPSSNSFGFRNDCTDYQRTEMFLRVYN